MNGQTLDLSVLLAVGFYRRCNVQVVLHSEGLAGASVKYVTGASERYRVVLVWCDYCIPSATVYGVQARRKQSTTNGYRKLEQTFPVLKVISTAGPKSC